MRSLETLTPRHEWTTKELVEANLRELCRFCFYDETTDEIYRSNPDLEARLIAVYRRLGGSAHAEFAGFELPIPNRALSEEMANKEKVSKAKGGKS